MKISKIAASVVALAVWAAVVLIAEGRGSPQPVAPLRALLITGGCCHDYEAQQKILTEGISARANIVWTILYEGGSSKGGVIRDHRMSIYEKPAWTKGYDVVVHNECFGDVTNADFVNHIAKGHFDGVAAVVIHCSIHSYRKSETDEWRKCLGVSSYNHENARPFKVINIDPEHPVMKGFPATWTPGPGRIVSHQKALAQLRAAGQGHRRHGRGASVRLGQYLRQGPRFRHHPRPRQRDDGQRHLP